MWIKGFIQQGILGTDDAVFGHVHIVKDIRRTAGKYVGHMELVNGDDVLVKQHPCGTFHGTIIPGGLESEYAKYLNIPA